MRYEPLGCRKLLQAGDFVCFGRCSDGFIPKVPIEFSPAYIIIHVRIYIYIYLSILMVPRPGSKDTFMVFLM